MVPDMQKVIFYALLVFLPAHANDSPHYQKWLDFKKAFAAELGGPTGIYSIQDMLELNSGERAYLSTGVVDTLRWVRSSPPTSIAQVQFEGRQARIRGPGIKERDLLQPAGEPLALPNGLTVRGTLLRDKVLKSYLDSRQQAGIMYVVGTAPPGKRPTKAAAWWTSTFRKARRRRRSRSTSTPRTASCARTQNTSTARWY
jgi:hypothetical protein